MSSPDLVVIAGVLRDGTDEERFEALSGLHEPVYPALYDPIVDAIERGDARIRERGTWKLVRTASVNPDAIDAGRMRRLLAVGDKHRDGPMLVPLARTEGQSVDDVARLLFARKLHGTTYAKDALCDAIRDGRLSAATAREILERATDDDDVLAALVIAERSYDTTGDLGLRRAILTRFFSPGSLEVRSKACWALRRAEKDKRSPAGLVRFRLSPADVEDVFGHPRNALAALARLMRDDGALREVGVYDWLAELLKYRMDPQVRAMFAREPEAFREFLAAAVHIARNDYWLYLRTAAIEMLEKIVVHEDRDYVLSLLDGFPESARDLQYWIDRIREKLSPPPDPEDPGGDE